LFVKAYLGFDHLPLNTFSAIKHEQLAPTLNYHSWQAAFDRWNSTRSAKENHT
jgi:hypothetical protein